MLREYILRTISFDGRSLAFFRIMLGVVILLDLLHRVSVFELFYTERGVLPLEDVVTLYGRGVLTSHHFSLHLINGSDAFQGGLFLLAAAFAMGLSFGWNTRLCLIASWVLQVSLHTRNPLYTSAADVTLGLMLFWSIFLPLNSYFSIDKKRGKSDKVTGAMVAHVGSACYFVQVGIIYVLAAYAKFQVESWRDGSALLDVMHMDILATEFGRGLTHFPHFLTGLTWATLYIEAFGMLLLFLPIYREAARGVCFILFFGLHVGIAATCDIGLFPIISMVLWLPFVPGRFWELLRKRFSKATSGIPSAENLIPPESKSQSSVLSPIFSENLRAVVAVGGLLCVVLGTVPGIRNFTQIPAIGRPVYAFLSITKLAQGWSVFAEETSMSNDGWFVIQGTLRDGTDVDILRDLSPVEWDRPPRSGPKRLSIIWRTYLAYQERGTRNSLDRFAKYLNMKRKRSHGETEGYEFIRMVYIQEQPLSSHQDTLLKQIEFWAGAPPNE